MCVCVSMRTQMRAWEHKTQECASVPIRRGGKWSTAECLSLHRTYISDFSNAMYRNHREAPPGGWRHNQTTDSHTTLPSHSHCPLNHTRNQGSRRVSSLHTQCIVYAASIMSPFKAQLWGIGQENEHTRLQHQPPQ